MCSKPDIAGYTGHSGGNIPDKTELCSPGSVTSFIHSFIHAVIKQILTEPCSRHWDYQVEWGGFYPVLWLWRLKWQKVLYFAIYNVYTFSAQIFEGKLRMHVIHRYNESIACTGNVGVHYTRKSTVIMVQCRTLHCEVIKSAVGYRNGRDSVISGWLGFWQEERGRQNIIGRGNSFSKSPGQTWAVRWRVTGGRWKTDRARPCRACVKAAFSWKTASEDFSWQADDWKLEYCTLSTVQPRAEMVEPF